MGLSKLPNLFRVLNAIGRKFYQVEDEQDSSLVSLTTTLYHLHRSHGPTFIKIVFQRFCKGDLIAEISAKKVANLDETTKVTQT